MELETRSLNLDMANDLAFCHKSTYRLTVEAESVASIEKQIADLKLSGRRFAGVCPSSVVAGKLKGTSGVDYEALLKELILDLMGAGYTVVLFPNATRERSNETERNNDLPVIERVTQSVLEVVTQPDLISVQEDVDAVSIRELIAELEVAFVSRFHAMVGALSLGVPTVVVGWSHKYREVMQEFGLEDYVMDYQRLDITSLKELEGRALKNLESMSRMIEERLPTVSRSSARPLDDLLALLSTD
jgi:hypothetical protein